MALVDALGNLARFVLLPGQSHDLVGVKPLIHDVEFGMFLGDKLVAVTRGVVVWFSYTEQKPIPVPEPVRGLILQREILKPEM